RLGHPRRREQGAARARPPGRRGRRLPVGLDRRPRAAARGPAPRPPVAGASAGFPPFAGRPLKSAQGPCRWPLRVITDRVIRHAAIGVLAVSAGLLALFAVQAFFGLSRPAALAPLYRWDYQAAEVAATIVLVLRAVRAPG